MCVCMYAYDLCWIEWKEGNTFVVKELGEKATSAKYPWICWARNGVGYSAEVDNNYELYLGSSAASAGLVYSSVDDIAKNALCVSATWHERLAKVSIGI